MRKRSPPAPACCSIRISPAPSLPGSSTRPGARARAERGELAFGTVDCFLLWRLTGGKVHATDATNASRTLLFDIHRGAWDDELLKLFNACRARAAGGARLRRRLRRPPLRICSAAPIAIRGIAGDQQAATVGQACFNPGMMKSTYGTGCFALLNTGERHAGRLEEPLLTTIAYQFGGKRTYALEGSIFIAGAAVQWLRDGLGIVEASAETGRWRKPPIRDAGRLSGAGLRRPGRAVLEFRSARRDVRPDAQHRAERIRTRRAGKRLLPDRSICSRRCGGLAAGERCRRTVLRVDGGMVASDWTMQRLADLLDAPGRPADRERNDRAGGGLSRRTRRRACCRSRPSSATAGGSSGASRRIWIPRRGTENCQVGKSR
jgi:glycerol kinase